MRASGRSTLLTTRITGSRASSALRSTKRVCGSGPSLASTSSSTPSTIVSPRSTSPPKSAWPGVSTMLSFTPLWRNAVFLARIVIPFSRSRSIESSTRSLTSWFSRNAPDCQSIASTSVVLPWSTCATIATLRRSERPATAAGYLRLGDLGVPLRDARLGPALRDQEGTLRILLAELDPDLVDGRFHVAARDRPLLGDDRDRFDLRQQIPRKLVDLRLRCVSAREHAEVDTDVTVLVEERDRSQSLHCSRSYPCSELSNAPAAPSRNGREPRGSRPPPTARAPRSRPCDPRADGRRHRWRGRARSDT